MLDKSSKIEASAQTPLPSEGRHAERNRAATASHHDVREKNTFRSEEYFLVIWDSLCLVQTFVRDVRPLRTL